MGKPENLTVPEGEEATIASANRNAKTIKQKISQLISEGTSFPPLTEINRLSSLSDPSGVLKDPARATAKAKVAELTDLLTELESACAHLAGLILSLGKGLNNKEALDAAFSEVKASC